MISPTLQALAAPVDFDAPHLDASALLAVWQ
jgi:hypothetical protein